MADVEKEKLLARGIGPKYQDFHPSILIKLPYPSLNQFVLSLKNHEQLL